MASASLTAPSLTALSSANNSSSCTCRTGRVPAGCGYCFGTSPHPSERGQSAGTHHSRPVFKTPSMSLGLYLSTLSLPHAPQPACCFRLSVAVATGAPDTGGLLSASTPDRSIPLPSPGYTVATTLPSRCRWSPQDAVTAGVDWRGVRQSCDTPGTRPTDLASPLRPDRGY